MCGRAYQTYTDDELQIRYLNERAKRNPVAAFKPNYNIAPTQLSPIVLIKEGKLTIDRFRWGLVPFWAKDIKSAAKYSLINAKGEEIAEKRSYKSAFEKRRAIIPVTGFYEWRRSEEGAKKPFAIHHKSELILSLAGVWEHWQSQETDEEVYSFSIITTQANSFMKKIHDRMPVILEPKDEELWLDPDVQDLEKLKELIKPCPSNWLESFEISPMVNSPKNNRPEVLKPV